MAWLDYKKAYDMVPHSWISECLEMFGIANNVQDFLNNSMKSWKLELNKSGGNIKEKLISGGGFFMAIACLHCCLFYVWSH